MVVVLRVVITVLEIPTAHGEDLVKGEVPAVVKDHQILTI